MVAIIGNETTFVHAATVASGTSFAGTSEASMASFTVPDEQMQDGCQINADIGLHTTATGPTQVLTMRLRIGSITGSILWALQMGNAEVQNAMILSRVTLRARGTGFVDSAIAGMGLLVTCDKPLELVTTTAGGVTIGAAPDVNTGTGNFGTISGSGAKIAFDTDRNAYTAEQLIGAVTFHLTGQWNGAGNSAIIDMIQLTYGTGAGAITLV